MNSDLKQLTKTIKPIFQKHDVLKSSIFGSVARGDNTEASDIDLLVELEDSKTLLDLAGLKIDLEETLNKKVNLLTYRSVHPYIQQYVDQDAVQIYG